MKKQVIQTIVLFLVGVFPFFSSCSKKEEPKAQSAPSESLGGEMGETMPDAMNQAKEVRDELSQRAQQSLDEMKNDEKKETDPLKMLEGPNR